MIIDQLAKHDAIGWDVDGTLVDGRNAVYFRQFIFDNPKKRHCLVTFRTHDLLARLESDLARHGIRDIAVFEKVLSVPANIWMEWAILQQQRKGNKTGKLLLPETAYMEWKGFVCRQEGLTVLVDDDILNTERGCKRYGIALLDANAIKF